MTQNEILEALTSMKKLLTHMRDYPKDTPYDERWDRELQYQVMDTFLSFFPNLSYQIEEITNDKK